MKARLENVLTMVKPNPIKKIKDPAELQARLVRIEKERAGIKFDLYYDGDVMSKKELKGYEKKERRLNIREGWIKKQLEKLCLK